MISWEHADNILCHWGNEMGVVRRGNWQSLPNRQENHAEMVARIDAVMLQANLAGTVQGLMLKELATSLRVAPPPKATHMGASHETVDEEPEVEWTGMESVTPPPADVVSHPASSGIKSKYGYELPTIAEYVAAGRDASTYEAFMREETGIDTVAPLLPKSTPDPASDHDHDGLPMHGAPLTGPNAMATQARAEVAGAHLDELPEGVATKSPLPTRIPSTPPPGPASTRTPSSTPKPKV